LLLCDCDYN
jgi:hypothetical protein